MTKDDIQILNVKPGDVLVFRTDIVCSQQQTDTLVDAIKKKVDALNLDVKFLVLTSGLQLSVMRPDQSGHRQHPVVTP